MKAASLPPSLAATSTSNAGELMHCCCGLLPLHAAAPAAAASLPACCCHCLLPLPSCYC